MEIRVVHTSAERASAVAVELAGPIHHVCPRCGSAEHGRPVADGVHVSLSRDGGHGVVAIGPVPVGIDVQVAGSVSAEALAAADLSPADDPTAAWVAAEAAGKLTGQGLVGPPPTDVVITWVALPGDDRAHLVVAVATREPVTVRDVTGTAATSP